MPPFSVSAVPVERILPLRHAVLRAGLPFDAARFDGDDEPDALHLAALHDGDVIGCATLISRPLDDAPARQLRGMATDPAWRGRGAGRALLEEVHRHAGTATLWCNARLPAVPFYQRLGWRIISDRFDVPTAGPHHRMRRDPTGTT